MLKLREAGHDRPPSTATKRSEIAGPRREFDLKGWIALTWAVGFGLLYAKMVLSTKAPGLWGAVRRWIWR